MMIEYPAEGRIPELKTLWGKCFADPDWFIDGFFRAGFSPQRCRCITDGKVTAALYWFDGEYRGQKLAYVYAVATEPERRGQGLCRKLMADTHGLLSQQGYAACLLMPGEPGLRRMYEKFGYRDCCEICEITCQAAGKAALKEICWEEYEILRPDFLPGDGAVQQGLEYLSAYGKFYRGEDFLLSAVQEEDRLLGLELLGNTDAAPGILGTLSCREGTFRTAGKGRKTVMALPLKEGAQLPGYFGLTFD